MFKQDDDEYQQQEEWERIQKDQESSMGSSNFFNEADYFGDEKGSNQV